MYTVFLWYAALMLCFNISFIYVDSVIDIQLLNPFDLTEVQMQDLPNINNGTNSVLGNVTTNINNSTGSGNPFSHLTDSLFFSLQLIWNFIGFILGGYVFSMMYSFGLPTLFVNLFTLGPLAFFAVITAVHLWTGRL